MPGEQEIESRMERECIWKEEKKIPREMPPEKNKEEKISVKTQRQRREEEEEVKKLKGTKEEGK